METKIEKLAVDAVAKMRADLILSHTFYGVLISQVEPVITRKVPTMATDGKKHFVNPDWLMAKTPNQRLTVQRHEGEHDARRHHSRRGNRDPLKWNIAADYAINIDLVDEGYELPPEGLVDPKYRGMSAEEIYRSRELDEQHQKKQQQQQQESDEDDEADAGSGQDDELETEQDDETESDAGTGDESEPDEGEEEQDANGGGDADDEGEGDEQVEGAGNSADGNDEAEGETEGQGNAAEDSGDAEGGVDGELSSSGDPGGMGEVLDAAEDEAGLAESEANWERIVHQAAILAEKRGTLPGHVSRDIERAREPKQDWREVLRAWADQGSRKIETWNRPNRRFAGQGLILPSSIRDSINHIAMIVDTSGSMDDIALAAIGRESQTMLDLGIIDKMTVIYIDVVITRIDEWVTGDQMVFDPKGGGGTVLRPAFDYIERELDDVSLIVAMTDNFTDIAAMPGPAPSAQVLWAFTGYPEHVRKHLANPPWDAPAVDIGEH